MKTRCLPENNYRAVYFNGKTIRMAIDTSKPITELEYPEFFDIKITEQCSGKCPYCYMGSNPEDSHYENVVQKIKDYFEPMDDNQRPLQCALAGGEPTSCPEIFEVLETFHDLGITPNYTTNGMFTDDERFTEELIQYTKKYCGGVAVSCHPHLIPYWRKAAKLFAEAGIRLNFHIIISDKESSDYFREIYDEFHEVVDYFVLLPYGAIGRAKPKEIDWDYLVSVVPKDHRKIAFGANFHPYLVKNPGMFKVSLYDPESMSKYLDLKDMTLYPSSFNLTPIRKAR